MSIRDVCDHILVCHVRHKIHYRCRDYYVNRSNTAIPSESRYCQYSQILLSLALDCCWLTMDCSRLTLVGYGNNGQLWPGLLIPRGVLLSLS
jgi:hypothetical protein